MKARKFLLITGVVVVVMVVGVVIAMSLINAGLNELANERIAPIDMGQVSDGEYFGSFDLFPISVETKTTLVDHKIASIEILKHVSGKGKPAEAIVPKIIEAQRIDVDAIAGATYSSRAIQKSIVSSLSGK